MNLANALRESWASLWAPPPRMKLSEWAEAYRYLPKSNSARAGMWRNSAAPYLVDIMDEISSPTRHEVVAMLPSQVGKALDIDTPIKTEKGWSTMGALQPGDRIYDENGELCSVTFATPYMLDRKCYAVRFNDGSEIIADGEHRWYVQKSTFFSDYKKYRDGLKTTDELRRNLKHHVKSKDVWRNIWCIPVADPLVGTDSEAMTIDPYVLGYWLGDGHQYSSMITVGETDIDWVWGHLSNIDDFDRQFDEHNKNYQLTFRSRRRCANVTIDETEYNRRYMRKKNRGVAMPEHLDSALRPRSGRELLKALSLIENKHIPDCYKNASIPARFALLQGLLDSDGSIGERNGRIEIGLIANQLAFDTVELIRSLGFKPSVRRKTPIYKGKEYREILRITFMAYAETPVFRLPRKLARMRSIDDKRSRSTETKRRFIEEIVPVPSRPVRCIQVDSPSHLYLAGRELIPTHNTECLLNAMGYFTHLDPSPMLYVMPTINMAKSFSKQRISTLFSESPALKNVLKDPRSRDSGNTTLEKSFPGGDMAIIGSNAPSELASRPRRLLMFDEVDRFPPSAGTEGDPISIGKARTITFSNWKILYVSSPTDESTSRIYRLYLNGDQRRWNMPCMHCGNLHVWSFAHVQWPGRGSDGAQEPEGAEYICPHCGAANDERLRQRAIRRGAWIATNPGAKVASFWMLGLGSAFQNMIGMAEKCVEAEGNEHEHKSFVNTQVGELWKNVSERPDWRQLYERRDRYEIGVVPPRGVVLTAAVDVQGNRLEVEVRAWGRETESWSVEHIIIPGSPALPAVWDELTEILHRKYERKSDGAILRIGRMAVDSGHLTSEVYDWAEAMRDPRVMVIKGMRDENDVALGVPSKPKKQIGAKSVARSIDLYPIGVSFLKVMLFARLKRPKKDFDEYNPRYMHYPEYSEGWFKQLCAEELVTIIDKNGRPKQEWHQTSARNEALDLAVYNLAAMLSMGLDRWDDNRWLQMESAARMQTIEQKKPENRQPAPKPQSSWLSGSRGRR